MTMYSCVADTVIAVMQEGAILHVFIHEGSDFGALEAEPLAGLGGVKKLATARIRASAAMSAMHRYSANTPKYEMGD